MARQSWQGFLDRHTIVWHFVEEYDRSFWVDLADVSEEIRQATYPGGRARVREIRIRDAETQVKVTVANTATQTYTPRQESLNKLQKKKAATSSSDEESVILIKESFRRKPVARMPYRRNPSPKTTRELLYQLSCWNCGGRHRYAECRFPKTGQFCYKCGERQVTLRDCPRCAPTYRKRPYTTRRGPRDGRRGPPPHVESEGWPWADRRGSSDSSSSF